MQRNIRLLVLAVSALTLLTAGPATAAIDFFGTAKIKPTFYSNFDFQSAKNDGLIVNEGGLTGDQHIRSELRLGWKASGDNWSVKMIAEADVIMEKDSADRSYYISSDSPVEGKPNSGSEFGIERVELLYRFLPWLELETGWDIRALDIKTGGLLYGDDHPFLGFRGDITPATHYELLYLPIQNRTNLPSGDALDPLRSPDADDWRVYTLKITQDLAANSNTLPKNSFFGNADGTKTSLNMSVSPILAYSDNDSRNAQITYFGLEAIGQAGWFKPCFEVIAADGDFDNGADISSWAMYAGVEVNVTKAFNPYIAFRYTQGDDDASDNDVEGWVGITDIGRYSGLMGMDGNILGEDIGQSFGATLYSYAPERALKTNRYGGIGNGGSGDNPGEKIIAIGTRGDLSHLLPRLMYKTQAFFIWYDETNNLTNIRNPGKKVDDYAGTTFDMQLMYAFSKNFSVDYIFSTFLPGDGIKDQFGDDPAFVNCLTLAWTY